MVLCWSGFEMLTGPKSDRRRNDKPRSATVLSKLYLY